MTFVYTWAANSRVGVNIKALIGRCLCDCCLVRLCNNGKVKPAVFPVPVCADANTSLPSKTGGIAFACIGDGVSYPFFEIARNKGSDKPKDLNDIN